MGPDDLLCKRCLTPTGLPSKEAGRPRHVGLVARKEGRDDEEGDGQEEASTYRERLALLRQKWRHLGRRGAHGLTLAEVGVDGLQQKTRLNIGFHHLADHHIGL